jgi:hypothetical protein
MMPKVFCNFGGTRRLGRVVKFNTLTTVVKIMLGATIAVTIKRHNIKHNVIYYTHTRGWPVQTWGTSIRHITLPAKGN